MYCCVGVAGWTPCVRCVLDVLWSCLRTCCEIWPSIVAIGTRAWWWQRALSSTSIGSWTLTCWRRKTGCVEACSVYVCCHPIVTWPAHIGLYIIIIWLYTECIGVAYTRPRLVTMKFEISSCLFVCCFYLRFCFLLESGIDFAFTWGRPPCIEIQYFLWDCFM